MRKSIDMFRGNWVGHVRNVMYEKAQACQGSRARLVHFRCMLTNVLLNPHILYLSLTSQNTAQFARPQG